MIIDKANPQNQSLDNNIINNKEINVKRPTNLICEMNYLKQTNMPLILIT